MFGTLSTSELILVCSTNIVSCPKKGTSYQVELSEEEVESVISESNCVYNRRKLTKMNLDKLKELCITMNISTDGTKAVIIDRILSQ